MKNSYFYLVLININCIFGIRLLQIIDSKIYFRTYYSNEHSQVNLLDYC